MVKTYQLSELDSVATALWAEGQPYKCWVFDAPMGAGKTTLIHSLCGLLHVTDAVSSPTFALINEYNSPVAGTVLHMDWYRLSNEQEAIQAGMEDAILSGHYCFIEWPEKAAEILPPEVYHIHIEAVDEGTRTITAQAGAFSKKD